MSVKRKPEERMLEGRELRASTGRRHSVTQVAWAKNAPRNLGGEERMESKRESWPSEEMRAKR